MRARLLLLLSTGLLLASAHAEQPAADLEKAQGAWKVVALEVDGTDMSGAIKEMRLGLKDDQVTITGDFPDKELYGKFTCKLDAKTAPKSVDCVIAAGDEKGATLKGIYALDKDRLTICLRLLGNQRPAEFKTGANTRLALLSLERSPTPAGDPAAEKLFQQLEDKLAKAPSLAVAYDIELPSKGTIKLEGKGKGTLELATNNKGRFEYREALINLLVVSDGVKVGVARPGEQPKQQGETPKGFGGFFRACLTRGGMRSFLHSGGWEQTRDTDVNEIFRVSGCKLGKNEKVGERDALVLEYELDIKGVKQPLAVKLWLDSRTGLPLKRTVTGPVNFSETYTKFGIDEKVDDKRFELAK